MQMQSSRTRYFRRHRFWIATLWVALAPLACATTSSPELEPTAQCFRSVATTLADDAMGGRGLGSRGLRDAGNYLRSTFAKGGLKPADTGGLFRSHRQHFRAITGVRTGPANSLAWSNAETGSKQVIKFESQFMPFGFSDSESFAGELVYVGYGIVAEPLGYDDYAGIDVRGKVVLAMRYEPREDDPDSPFDGRRPSRFSDLRYKALKARGAGAAALILVSPPRDDEERLPRVSRHGRVSNAGIPVIQVSREVATAWLREGGQDFAALHLAIEQDGKPQSQAIEGVQITGNVDIAMRHTGLENIVGVLPGRGALADEAVVVGAHFDHLGHGGPASLARDGKAIHNGADDNASGVAAMICGAGGVVKRRGDGDTARRTLIVTAFSGEEAGLLGSAFYVDNAIFPIEKTMAMVNLDMVGRLRDAKLYAMGSDSSPAWRSILEPLASLRKLDLVAGGDGYGPSDQMSFYGAGVPVVHFFTGSHVEYHTPQDDIETLNIEGGARITSLLTDLLDELLHREEALVYQSSINQATMPGDSRGFGAYLGSVPDYAEMMNTEGGVLLSGVKQGGPADVAGITGGDRLIEMGGIEIQNLYDMTFVLRDHRPGEVIEIKFIRDGETLAVGVTLGRRGESKKKAAAGKDPHVQLD
ncbi:MAG: aminopeptidase YwaD [Myxococcota bacterium]|jgi:aminopeptidase YwaD